MNAGSAAQAATQKHTNLRHIKYTIHFSDDEKS